MEEQVFAVENRPHEDPLHPPQKASTGELRQASLWPLAGLDELQAKVPRPGSLHPYISQSVPPPLPPRDRSQSFNREDRVPPGDSPKKHGNVSTYIDSGCIAQTSCSLSEFVEKFSKDFPIQVRINQGFYGKSLEGTLTTHDMYTAIRVSRTQVVCIETTKGGYSFDVPMGSAVQFSLLYNYNPSQKETSALNGYVFKTAADIIEATQLPKVVCTTVDYQSQDPSSSVEANEILVVHRVTMINEMRKLEVFSLHTKSTKLLEGGCAGSFSTKPSLIRMYLTDIRKHVKDSLPSHAVIHFAMEVPTEFQDQPSIIKMSGWREKSALIASPEEHTGESSLLFEIPLDGSLSEVEVIVVRDGRRNDIYDSIDLKKFDFTKLVPWKRNSEEADVISNMQQFFKVTLRQGYQNLEDCMNTPVNYEEPISQAADGDQGNSTAVYVNYADSEYIDASSSAATPVFDIRSDDNKTQSPELLAATVPAPESSSEVESLRKRIEWLEHRFDHQVSPPPHVGKLHSLERNVSMQHSSFFRTASVPMRMPNFQPTFQGERDLHMIILTSGRGKTVSHNYYTPSRMKLNYFPG